MTTEEQVIEIIAEKLGVSKEEIKPEASFIEDLGADSLDQAELIMELEEKFGITFQDDREQNLHKVKDAVRYVEKLVKAE